MTDQTDSTVNAHRERIANAIKRRQAARSSASKAASALDRAQDVAASAKATHDTHQRTTHEHRESQARILQDWIQAGAKGERPATISNDERLRAAEAAKHAHEVADKALSNLQAANDASRQELAAAEQGLTDAVDALFAAEAVELANQAEALDKQARDLRSRLVALDSLNDERPVNKRTSLPASALALLHPNPNIYQPPRYYDEFHLNGPHKSMLAQHQAEWKRRRASLIAGEIEDDVPQASAA